MGRKVQDGQNLSGVKGILTRNGEKGVTNKKNLIKENREEMGRKT